MLKSKSSFLAELIGSCPRFYHSSGFPAKAASLECGDFYRLEHHIEAIRQIHPVGSGEPADFVFGVPDLNAVQKAKSSS